MERRQFLGNLSGPVVAVCAVCLGACSKSSDGATPNPPNPGTPTPPSGGSVTIDLASNLTTIGSSIVTGGIIIARLSAGNTPASFTAVQVACTHQGTSINFDAANNRFVCPNHGSIFTTSGAVTLGPASSALKVYTITIAGNTMTITG